MKTRQYCIVIHNVKQNIEPIVRQHNVQKAKEMLMSVEPYPEGDGFHLHLFIQYPNQRSFTSVLNEYSNFAKRLTVPKPENETRSWGRVQVDPMRGRFDQANAYLQGDTKNKPTGEVISYKKKPCWRRMRYTSSDKKKMEEFCGRCHMSICPGCCPGCRICDEDIKLQEDMEWWNKMITWAGMPEKKISGEDINAFQNYKNLPKSVRS